MAKNDIFFAGMNISSHIFSYSGEDDLWSALTLGIQVATRSPGRFTKVSPLSYGYADLSINKSRNDDIHQTKDFFFRIQKPN